MVNPKLAGPILTPLGIKTVEAQGDFRCVASDQVFGMVFVMQTGSISVELTL